jgi:hypothetical protein
VFTPFHKPPYTYPYGRSVDETTTQGLAKDWERPTKRVIMAIIMQSDKAILKEA